MVRESLQKNKLTNALSIIMKSPGRPFLRRNKSGIFLYTLRARSAAELTSQVTPHVVCVAYHLRGRTLTPAAACVHSLGFAKQSDFKHAHLAERTACLCRHKQGATACRQK